MALMQLVATNTPDTFSGRADEHRDNPNGALTAFGESATFEVARHGDEILETYLAVQLSALPQGCGWKWRPGMPHHLLEKWSLEIGNMPVWKRTRYSAAAWAVSHVLRDEEMYEPAADGSYEFFLPIHTDPIPTICLGFHSVKYILQTTAFSELVVPDYEVPAAAQRPLAEVEAAVQKSFTLRHLWRCHNGPKRRELAINPQELLYSTTIANTVYPTVSVDRPTKLELDSAIIATGAYIHILDEKGAEIPTSCIERIVVKLNGHDRHSVRGSESRIQMKHQMTCSPRQDVKSKNLYFIPYGTGQTLPDRREEGLNLRRIDNYRMELNFKPGTPEKLTVTVIHRYSQIFFISHGIGENRWYWATTMKTDDPVWKGDDSCVSQFGTEKTDGIAVLEGDMCPISYADITVDSEVCLCGRCKKVFESEAMKQWFLSVAGRSKTCPTCRVQFTNANFFYGKAKLET
jgi:hypothetical protein